MMATPKLNKDGPTIWPHGTADLHDWCHICGKRDHGTADVWYGHNAEHNAGDAQRYVRICGVCAEAILAAASQLE